MARKLFITQAIYLEGYKIKVVFNDGVEKTINFETFLNKHPHPQHNKYRDLKNFTRFHLEHGNIVWGTDWDLIFPIEELHKGSIH